jgi:hypothetical protein
MKGSECHRSFWTPKLARSRPNSPAAAFHRIRGVHVLVEVTPGDEFPMAAIAQAGRGLDWLAEEPELYSDADLIEPTR